MSWKSLITASLLWALASPAFGATTPQLEIINDGVDPTTGNYVWYVRVAPSTSGLANDPDGGGPIPTGTPVAAELGFRTNVDSPMRTATNLLPSIWDTSIAGTTIFGWEDLYQTLNSSGIATGNFAAEGMEMYCGANCTPGSPFTLTNATTYPLPQSGNPAHVPTTYDATQNDHSNTGGAVPANGEGSEVFTALGSDVQAAGNTGTSYALRNPNLMAGPTVIGSPVVPGVTDSNRTQIDASTQYLKFLTKGPIAPLASSPVNASLQLLGKHGTGTVEGRLAEITTGTNGSNYKGYAGTASISIKPGDVNLDGVVNGLDVGILSTNIFLTGKNWTHGDFNGDGTVNGLDVGILSTNIFLTGGAYTKVDITGTVDPVAAPPLGSSSLTSGDVPEPASIALLALALLGGLGLMRRKR